MGHRRPPEPSEGCSPADTWSHSVIPTPTELQGWEHFPSSVVQELHSHKPASSVSTFIAFTCILPTIDVLVRALPRIPELTNSLSIVNFKAQIGPGISEKRYELAVLIQFSKCVLNTD